MHDATSPGGRGAASGQARYPSHYHGTNGTGGAAGLGSASSHTTTALGARDAAKTSAILVPPRNFSLVAPGIYRSGYPHVRNFEFLAAIGVKSFLFMCPEEYSAKNMEKVHQYGMRVLQVGVEGNKEPFVDIPEDRVRDAIEILLDERNHPIVVHCNKGKVRR